MRRITLTLLCLMPALVFAKTKIDSALLKKIVAMYKEDQKWRTELIHIQDGKQSIYSETEINKNMNSVDSANLIAAKLIIKKYGFPGYDLVGEAGSDDFWAIVQHCDNDVPFQQQALKLMAKEVKKHNATGENLALLQDRVLIAQGHKQIYGTQIRLDLKTHQAKPLPIQDSLNVDKRRKAVGLSPLTDYLKLFQRR